VYISIIRDNADITSLTRDKWTWTSHYLILEFLWN